MRTPRLSPPRAGIFLRCTNNKSRPINFTSNRLESVPGNRTSGGSIAITVTGTKASTASSAVVKKRQPARGDGGPPR